MQAQTARATGSRLPRSAKLLDTPSFDRVFAAPRRSSDGFFTVLGREPPADGTTACSARLGLAIAKRCAPRAVDRNRIKRVIRESFRHARSSLQPMDLVVLCRRTAVEADNAILSASLTKHWKRFQK